MEGPETIILRPFFRHALALVFHLLIIVSFIPAFCWRRWAGYSNRASQLVIDRSFNPTFAHKRRLGLKYKLILCCCISLAVCHTLIGIWSTVYWWLEKRANNFSAQAEYIVEALAWYMMSYYAYHSVINGRKEKFPLLLKMWWFLSSILFTFFLILDILFLRDRKSIYPCIWVDILALSICSFLCYVSYCGRTSTDSFTQSIQEPLLESASEKSENIKLVTPYATANFISLMSFSWLNTLIAVGYKKPLQIEDVPQLADADGAEEVYSAFRNRLQAEGLIDTRSLAKATLLSVWKEVVFSAFFSAVFICASYVGPYLMDAFVQYLHGNQQFRYQGYALAATFFVAMLTESLAQRQLYFKLQMIGIHFKVAFMAAIYRKGLLLSSQARQRHTSGEIINYMSVDAERIGDFSWSLHEFWSVPLQVLVGLFVLYKSLGLASLVGLAAIVVIMIGNTPLGNLQEKFQNKIMEAKDRRMKATSETLRNMKILKLQA